MRKSVYLIAVISIMAAYFQYEVRVYQALVPVLLWLNSTLSLNVAAERMGWQNCKWYGICVISAHPPVWRIIRKDEVAFRG